MATTGKKKKLVSTIAAVATSAALLLGGTLAWQSANQTALNEASDVINPGGRLHDDFYIDANGDYNADIYVENFDKEDIFARVQLQEYMEVIMNYGTKGEKPYDVLGEMDTAMDGSSINKRVRKDADGNIIEELYEREYTTRGNYEPITENYTVDAGIDKRDNANPVDYWTWTMGSPDSETVYFMPTFNKNKDSLVADRNGMYVDRIGGISNWGADQYEDYTIWQDGDPKTADAIYDSDIDDIDDVKYDFENLTQYIDAGNIATVEEEHIAKAVGTTNGFITMTEWLDKLNNGEATENYWVWDDTDENNGGWIYWSSPIPAGETTGLLLDSIELKDVMDDTWYYAINVIAQFVTADDAGKADGTGFYDTEKGSVPSANAETLLEEIGVRLSDGEEEYEPQTLYLELNWNEDASVNANPGDKIILSINPDDEATYGAGDLSDIAVSMTKARSAMVEGEDYTYDPDTKALVILSETAAEVFIDDNTGNFGGYVVLASSGDDGFASSGTLQGLNMSLYSDSEYIEVNEETNTLRIDPTAGWTQVYVTLDHETLQLGDTTQAIYEWSDADGDYIAHDEEIVDIEYYPDGLDLNLTPDAAGLYKLTASYDDGAGTTYSGEIEFTIVIGSGGGDDDEYFDNPITVNGDSPDSNGYIYLYGLDIDQVNSFDVNVHGDFELAEDGLTCSTATYVEDTKLTVNEDDPYTGILTIAARDYQVVTITATDVNGDSYSVYVVPIYSTIIITPEMNGQTLTLPSGSYALQAEGFTDNDNTTFELSGAKRCITDLREGQWRLSVSSYESSEDITLIATDGTEIANIKLVVSDAIPNDGPLYSYYIDGKGETWSYAFIETQEYAWVQDDNYTYKVYAGMANDFDGVIDWTITGATEEGESVYFTDEAGAAKNTTYTGREPRIKFTAEQTEPFILSATIYADAERNEIYTYTYYNNEGESFTGTGDPDYHYFTIIPVKNGHSLLRSISVESDFADYYNPYYLTPGSYGEVYFNADVRDGDPISNADVTWSLVTVEEGCTFEITEDEDNYATVTHTCTDEESCTHVGAVKVMVSYDHAYGQTGISEFYILPEGYAGNLEFEDDGGSEEDNEPHFYFDGDYELPLAVPAGTEMSVVLDSLTIYDTYAITAKNNAGLKADDNGYYTAHLDEKEGLTVIAMPGEYAGETFTQYFYGEEIPLTEDAGEGSYTFNFSDPDTADSVENVTIVAVDEDGSIITQVSTKVYDPDTHTYADSNSANQGSSGWLLVFDALDENGSSVGYCVANAAQTQLSVDPMYPASAYVTEGTFEDDFNVSDDFNITAASPCTGTHGSSIEGVALFHGSTQLTEVHKSGTESMGGTYALSVKSADGQTEYNVTSWRVKGAQSSGTYIEVLPEDEMAMLYVGYFETAESLTILATLEDEQFFNEFTVTVASEETSLTDLSNEYVLTKVNPDSGSLDKLDSQLFEGAIHNNIYVVKADGFEDGVTTLADATLLDAFNGMSLEVAGGDPRILDITGGYTDWEDESNSFDFGVHEDGSIAFRTERWSDETHSLYVIAYDENGDGSYVKFDFTTDLEGE